MTDSLRLTIVTFKNELDNRPTREDSTWGELKARLSRFEIRPGKSGPAYSPVRYTDGATRGNAGVELVYVAVMDVDDGTDPKAVHYQLTKLGFEHVIHSTHSSTPEHPKFRAIVPLAEPISGSEWPAIFPCLCVLLANGHTDPATKDPARLFYFPSAKPGGKTFTYAGHGRAVSLSDIPPAPERPAGAPPAPAVRVETGADGKIPHGRHHEVIVSTAASLAARVAGISEAALVEAVRGALAPLFDDLPTHEAEIAEAARSAVGKFGRAAPVPGPESDGDGIEAFEANRARVARIVRTKDEIHGYTVLIWGAHTHLIDRFESTFYLGFKGKTGAGKGTSVESCIALTPNGEVLGETTESYLASATDDGKAIGVEELDLLLERNPYIESLFRSGYRRGAYGGFKAPAKEGKGWEQARRSLFGPKVYDTHAGPSGHLLGRSILIEMEPDDSVDRALDAEYKVEALSPVKAWLAAKARRALEEWPPERFRAWWDSPEFRERVRKLGGRGGRDHVIGALMLATCDMMEWSLDAEIGTILAGRATIEEFGVEMEVLDALRELAPAPKLDTEVLFADVLKTVNAERKRTGVGRSLNGKTLAGPLKELGFKKGGDGSDTSDEWFKAKAGPNRDRSVLRPYRVLASFAPIPGNASHASRQSQLYRPEDGTDGRGDVSQSSAEVNGPDGTDGSDSGSIGTGARPPPNAPATGAEARRLAREGFDQGAREEGSPP
jgi:hypothetical protein